MTRILTPQSEGWAGPIYHPSNGWRSLPQNIRFLAENPCGASPWVYVQFLIPVLAKTIFEFYTFGLSDIAIGYARPGGLPAKLRGRAKPWRSWRRHDKERKSERFKGRDGHRRTLRERAFPEIGNEIGKHLPGSRLVQSLTDNTAGRLAWVPVDLAERAAWYYMLATLTKEGVYDWASDIYETSCPDAGYAPAWSTARSWGRSQPFGPVYSPSQPSIIDDHGIKASVPEQGRILHLQRPANVFYSYNQTGPMHQVIHGPRSQTAYLQARNRFDGTSWIVGQDTYHITSEGTINVSVSGYASGCTDLYGILTSGTNSIGHDNEVGVVCNVDYLNPI